MSHIHSCAVSCDKLAVQLLFRDASVVSQGTPRRWRGGNGHDLLVCVFMCMLSCFSCINEMCVYCIFLYNLRLYRERERERMNHRNALCMPLFHHVWLPSCRPPSLSFLSGIFLFSSPTSPSLLPLSLPISCRHILLSERVLRLLLHFLFLPLSSQAFYPFIIFFFKHFLPSFNAFLPLLYLCRSLFLLWLSLSLLCLFPFDLPPNDSRLLFVHFRAWIWVCVQAHTCTSQFESVNDCPLRVQHAVYRASRFLSRTCCMIITLCSLHVFVTIHHFAFFIIIFFLFPTCFFIIIFVCLRAYGSNTLPYLTYICALVFLCVTVPVGSCILYFVSEAKPSRAAH